MLAFRSQIIRELENQDFPNKCKLNLAKCDGSGTQGYASMETMIELSDRRISEDKLYLVFRQVKKLYVPLVRQKAQ